MCGKVRTVDSDGFVVEQNGLDVRIAQPHVIRRHEHRREHTPHAAATNRQTSATKPKQKRALKTQEVLGNYDPDNFVTERHMVLSRDGESVPLSIVFKKNNFSKNGQSPVLLYAYGAYGYSTDPSFKSSRISLLDRGFAYAIAHVRGGQEMGRSWYESGKLMKKKNTR